MGAELLEPFAKWGAIALLAGIALLGVVQLISSRAVAKDDLKEAEGAQEAAQRAAQAATNAPKSPRAVADQWLRSLRKRGRLPTDTL